MTSSHRHGKTGTLAVAGDVDSVISSLTTRVSALEAAVAKLTPPPPPPTGAVRYLSPGGSDNNDGSIGSPWATLARFYATAKAGDTLVCRGGTYVSGPSVTVTSVGTDAAPISVTAYPGEQPVFLGTADGGSFLLFDGGAAHHVLDGLTFKGPLTSAAGMLWIGNGQSASGGPPVTGPVTIRRCTLDKGTGGRIGQHGVYVSWWAKDVTVDGCVLLGSMSRDGMVNEGGIHIFHAPQVALNTVVRDCVFDDWSNGVILWDETVPPALTASITHCTFVRCDDNIDNRWHAAVTVRDNAGTHGLSNDLYDPEPPNGSGMNHPPSVTTADHNYWGVAIGPAPAYALPAGSPAIGGASDGTNAGARQ